MPIFGNYKEEKWGFFCKSSETDTKDGRTVTSLKVVDFMHKKILRLNMSTMTASRLVNKHKAESIAAERLDRGLLLSPMVQKIEGVCLHLAPGIPQERVTFIEPGISL